MRNTYQIWNFETPYLTASVKFEECHLLSSSFNFIILSPPLVIQNNYYVYRKQFVLLIIDGFFVVWGPNTPRGCQEDCSSRKTWREIFGFFGQGRTFQFPTYNNLPYKFKISSEAWCQFMGVAMLFLNAVLNIITYSEHICLVYFIYT